MATLFDNFSPDFSASDLPGGGFEDLGGGLPFLPGLGGGGGGGGGGGFKSILSHHPILGGLFGSHDEKPKTPYWQRLANREWAQGNAVLSAYSRLYNPTLALVRQQTADYGDLYRKAANEALAHDITSSRTTREADLADYLRLGPQLLSARREADPLFSKSYDLAASDLNDVDAPLPANVRRDITEAVRGSQVNRGMGLGGSDAFEEAMALVLGGENFRNQRRDRAFGEARSLLDVYGDPFQSLTGRVARPQPQGATVMAPQVGSNWDDLFSYGVNREIQGRNLGAANSASNKALAGQIVGGLLSGAGAAAGACWVARAVFGPEDPKWRWFRVWLLTRAPERFRNWYLKHGERFALKIKMPHRANTRTKLRRWMETKINELFGGWPLAIENN